MDPFEVWEQEYEPVTGLTDCSGPVFGSSNVSLIEASTPDIQAVELIESKAPGSVWSLVVNGEQLSIKSGMYRKNSVGYFVTRKPAPTRSISVNLAPA